MAVIRHFITSTVCQFDMMLCRQSDTSATSKQVRQNVASATCTFDNIYVRQLGFRHNVVRHFCIRQLGLRQGNVAPPTGGIGNNTTKLGVKEPRPNLKTTANNFEWAFCPGSREVHGVSIFPSALLQPCNDKADLITHLTFHDTIKHGSLVFTRKAFY
jgi:hypothetical protein